MSKSIQIRGIEELTFEPYFVYDENGRDEDNEVDEDFRDIPRSI